MTDYIFLSSLLSAVYKKQHRVSVHFFSYVLQFVRFILYICTTDETNMNFNFITNTSNFL